MSNRVCHQLVLSSWATGFQMIFPPLILGLKLEFCDSNVIDHFICDSSPILQISCSDTHFLELMSFLLTMVTLMAALMLVILSYAYIIKKILKFLSVQQRTKAFSTCYSHMIVVSISYGSCIFMYIKAPANDRVTLNKGVAVLNTSVAPLLNPFIYTLRNQLVKHAFKNMAQMVWFTSNKWENSKMYKGKKCFPFNLGLVCLILSIFLGHILTYTEKVASREWRKCNCHLSSQGKGRIPVHIIYHIEMPLNAPVKEGCVIALWSSILLWDTLMHVQKLHWNWCIFCSLEIKEV